MSCSHKIWLIKYCGSCKNVYFNCCLWKMLHTVCEVQSYPVQFLYRKSHYTHYDVLIKILVTK